MFSDTDDDTLLIYERGESSFDALTASYIAVKCKRDYSQSRKFSGLQIVPGVIPVDCLVVQMMPLVIRMRPWACARTSDNNWISESWISRLSKYIDLIALH